MMIYLYLPFFIILAGAAWCDIKASRIPNWLTLPPAAVALALALIFGGVNIFYDRVLGAALVGGVWLIFWRFGIIGGGDQKLMFFVGSFLGLRLAVPVIFFVALAGGIQALVFMLYKYFWPNNFLNLSTLRNIPMPYAVAIASGTLASVLFGSRLLVIVGW